MDIYLARGRVLSRFGVTSRLEYECLCREIDPESCGHIVAARNQHGRTDAYRSETPIEAKVILDLRTQKRSYRSNKGILSWKGFSVELS